MTPEVWARVKAVLEAVDELSGAARDEALESLCQGDSELRSEVDSLLAQESRIGILERTANTELAAAPGDLRQIGPYRIEKLLGAGGMGAVYLASRADEQYEKRVAIKVIQSLGGPDLARRFRNERQILASLDHPSIARLLDGGTLDDGRPYLVMDYVDGQRIDEYVDARRPSVGEILRLFLKVCSAVQFAHQNLIVHRDLKPGNILVTGSGEPYLLDFGIAKVLSDEADLESTKPFARLLTPSYASPEQLCGGAVTTATDVYSLGVLLYRLLTGASPYAGAPNFPADPVSVILQYEPPLASTAASRVSRGDLDTILRKALEKNPARRYPTVEEFAGDLRRYLADRPILARPDSVLYRARKFVARNRFAVASGLVLILAIFGGITGTLINARRAQLEKARADRRYEELRRLSESLLFELHDSIQNLAGATDARALLARRALQYLDQLAAENNTDPKVQRDLASAYVRVSGILANDRAPHVGGASALKMAYTSSEKALEIRRHLYAANPADPGLQHELLESLWTVAGEIEMQGDLKRSLALQQERLKLIGEMLQKGRSLDVEYSRGTTYAAMSELHRLLGDFDQALGFGRQSLEARQALLNADPQSARAQRVVGLSHEMIGYAFAEQGRYREAAGEHIEALADFERLAARDPHNFDLQRNVHVAESNLCEVLARAGAANEGIGHCRRAVTLADAMYRADRDNIQTAEDLASNYATLGFALHVSGRLREALEWERKAKTEYEMAIAKDPDSSQTEAFYGEVLLELGRIERELGEADACALIRQAREQFARLTSRMPGNQSVRRNLEEARQAGGCG